MKDMLKMGLFLFIVSAIAATLLAFTESKTAPQIKLNQKLSMERAQKEVLPSATTFTTFQLTDEKAKKDIKMTYTAGFTEKGELAGVVLETAPKGYAGEIKMVIGIDISGRVKGVKITSHSETPGLGSKLKGDAFMNSFNKIISEKADPTFMLSKDGGDIDSITAATISARAFCTGIRSALEQFKHIKPNFGNLKIPTPKTLPAIASLTIDATGDTK